MTQCYKAFMQSVGPDKKDVLTTEEEETVATWGQ